MQNYKLTTDLIADCMALIPENLERLNTKLLEYSGAYFVFTPESVEKQMSWDQWNSDCFNADLLGHQEFDQFLIASHSLRTIPEFQDDNPAKVKKIKKRFKNLSGQSITKADLKNLLAKTTTVYNRTIASATLHGKGKFPPSTLEELCESYKNVMK